MTKADCLLELIEDDTRRLHQLLDDCPAACLRWSPDGQANSIAVTLWHTARIFDVFLTQHIRANPMEDEIWYTAGWSARSGYDPRGLGTLGWGAVTGYSLEEVKAIPEMNAELLRSYFNQVMTAIQDYLEVTPSVELSQPSAGFEGKQTNYYWIRHALWDLTRHLGEMMALHSMWKRANPQGSADLE
jgi:uncharacterized damage-inducible protein DinB